MILIRIDTKVGIDQTVAIGVCHIEVEISDMTSFLEVTIALYQIISYTDIYRIMCIYSVCV